MKYERIGPGVPWHGEDCRCSSCTPPAPADFIRSPIELAALLAIAGFGVAMVLIEIYAVITGAAGIEVIFG